tara:strand:- start:48 stop:440 length:393 start_codon:yes stop_codon:yes gene_type:complete
MPKPKCEKGYKLVKSRCECKKTQKTTKKTKKKTPKKKTKDKYQEHWALVKGQYSLNMPSDKQLKVRRRRIDEVYTLYDNIKKVDKSIPHPKKWHSPPEFCYNEQLQNMIKAMKQELKDKLKDKLKEKGII